MAEAFFKGYQKIDHHHSEAVAKQGSETGVRNRGAKQGSESDGQTWAAIVTSFINYMLLLQFLRLGFHGNQSAQEQKESGKKESSARKAGNKRSSGRKEWKQPRSSRKAHQVSARPPPRSSRKEAQGQ